MRNSAAQFIVFREKRRMNWREILREKWATKNARKIMQKNEQKSPKYYVKLASFLKIRAFEFQSLLPLTLHRCN